MIFVNYYSWLYMTLSLLLVGTCDPTFATQLDARPQNPQIKTFQP